MNHTDARVNATCPTQETLAAFLAASGALAPELTRGWPRDAVSEDEMQALGAHVAACNRCVEDLRTASRRLALAADMPLPVPSHVVARALAYAKPRAVVPTASSGWLAVLREGLAAITRMPVLVPAALAALALIVIVPRLQAPSGSQPELSRAVEVRQSARVTVDKAAVRAARDDGATVLVTLARGDHAILIGEEDGWYRVALGDGTEGWIERRAFE